MINSISTTLNVFQNILVEARNIIDIEASPDGTKGVKIMELAGRVGERYNKTDAELYQIIRIFIDNCHDLEMRRGRNGGIYKKLAVAHKNDNDHAVAALP